MKKIALISVSDKEGVINFVRELIDLDFQIISTGGTYKILLDNNIDNIIKIEDYTNFPEILDGRVKTLHPKIHAGILANKDLTSHMNIIRDLDILAIDLVCVNLYPFSATISKENYTFREAIENIDIGGSSLIRASSKNWENVITITDKNDYKNIIKELKEYKDISKKTRFYLAKKAFSHTAYYDGEISNYLTSINNNFIEEFEYKDEKPTLDIFPEIYNKQFKKIKDLRYGENPHQVSALYIDSIKKKNSFIQMQGKELSYNNIADMDCAWECVKSFNKTACVIVKHANPCAVSLGKNAKDAYKLAFASDKISAFGGIIAFNTLVDGVLMDFIINQCFIEVLIAPDFSLDALNIVSKKPNIRVIKIPSNIYYKDIEVKSLNDGELLLQTYNNMDVIQEQLQVVSNKLPTEAQMQDLIFLFKVAKFSKSNAIVVGKDGTTYGIGSGQTSRIDSVSMAIRKAQQAGLNLDGSCCASDAFFPFRDGVDIIAKNGIKAIIHPGGSIRDNEVIESANENDIVMVTTKLRHFKH